MKKILCPAIALALLLTACAQAPRPSPIPSPSEAATATPSPTLTPSPEPSEEPKELWGFPIDDTHDAFEVDTGGKLGTVLVTVEQEQSDNLELGDLLLVFSVWHADELTTPIQTMTAESWGSLHGHEVLDINFDGYMDLSYVRSWGTGGVFCYHWRWDENAGQFVAVPELTEYGSVVFDPETKTVLAHVKAGSAGLDAWDDIYLWENETPVCVRRIKWFPHFEADDSIVVTGTVSDRVNGNLAEVFSTQSTEDDFWDELEPWYNLGYHG